jgi:hypothetical protein
MATVINARNAARICTQGTLGTLGTLGTINSRMPFPLLPSPLAIP